jgi:hypothetical protein
VRKATGSPSSAAPLTADPGLTLTMMTAPAGSPDDDALRLLASWAATRQTDYLSTPPQGRTHS